MVIYFIYFDVFQAVEAIKIPNSGFSKGNLESEVMDIGKIVDDALKQQPGDSSVKEILREVILQQSVDSVRAYLDTHLTFIDSSHRVDDPGSTTDNDCIPFVDCYSTIYHGVYKLGKEQAGIMVRLNYGTPFNYKGNRNPTVKFSRLVELGTSSGLLRQAIMELDPAVHQIIQEKCGAFLQGLLRERQKEIRVSNLYSRPGW